MSLRKRKLVISPVPVISWSMACFSSPQDPTPTALAVTSQAVSANERVDLRRRPAARGKRDGEERAAARPAQSTTVAEACEQMTGHV